MTAREGRDFKVPAAGGGASAAMPRRVLAGPPFAGNLVAGPTSIEAGGLDRIAGHFPHRPSQVGVLVPLLLARRDEV